MNKKTINEELGRIHSIMFPLTEAKTTAIRNALKTVLKTDTKALLKHLNSVLPSGTGINTNSILSQIDNLEHNKKIANKLSNITTAIENGKRNINTELAVQRAEKTRLIAAGASTTIVDDNIRILEKAHNKLETLESKYNDSVNALDGSRVKDTATGVNNSGGANVNIDIDNTSRSGSGSSGGPGTTTTAGSTTTAAPIPPPPLTGLVGTAGKLLKTKTILIGSAILAGAGALAYLIYWLTKISKDPSDKCLGVTLQTYGRYISVRDPKAYSETRTYLTVKPTNIFFKNYPIIVLEYGGNKNLVWDTKGNNIGTWAFIDGCVLTVSLSGKNPVPVFKTEQSVTPNPKPNPAPAPKYKRCAGRYSLWCVADKIMDLQKCLNITVDGKWGPNTQRAVQSAGLMNILTDQDIDTFCGRTPNPPQPPPKPEQGEESQNTIY